jgi:ribosomal protein S1
MATANTSNKSSAMAALLAAHKDQFKVLHKGEVLKGKITKLTAHEILVDLGAKTEAIVLEKDKQILHTLLSTFKVGETVEISVLNPESDSGQPVVSMRRFLGDLSWGKLEQLQKNKGALEVIVTDMSKAGYVVDTPYGLSGFLPQSRMSFSQNNDITIGSKIKVIPLELNRKDNKVIFSQEAALSEEDFHAIESQFKPEQKVEVTITNVTSNGLYVILAVPGKDLQIEGTIHISEISWDKVANLPALYTAGQQIEAAVIRFDAESRKVQLSVKRLSKDPFEEIMEKYPVDMKTSGTVSLVDDAGVSVTLGDGVEGLIRKEKILPTTTYTVGQKVSVLVSEYDKRRKKVILAPVLLEKPIGYR